MALSTRDTDVYTSPNGLRFPTSYSGQYLDCQGNWDCDLNQQIDTRSATSVQACEDLCSTARPLCYGVSFNTGSNTCNLKGSPMVNLTASSSYVSYAADTSQIIGTTQSCTNGTSGICNVVCDEQFGPSGNYQPTNIAKGFHADTFQQCSDYCSKARPLCKSFTWNPVMDYGYANCYLKNVSLSTLSGGSWSGLQNCDVLSSTYQTIASTSSYSGYNVSSAVVSGNFDSVHATSLDSCVQACNGTCIGVNLDLTFASGYQNCYLLNATGTTQSNSGWTLALKQVTSSVSSSSTASSSTTPTSGSASNVTNATSSTSQAWIAGPVIGALAVLAGIAFLIFWLRKRKRDAPPAYIPPAYGQNEKSPNVVYSYFGQEPAMAPSELESPPAMLHGNEMHRHELSAHSPPMELPGSPRQK